MAMAVLALGAAAARAADDATPQARVAVLEPKASSRTRRTVLHFDDDSIRGDLTRPDGELVQAPRRLSESSLLRVRRSFTDRALAGVVRGE